MDWAWPAANRALTSQLRPPTCPSRRKERTFGLIERPSPCLLGAPPQKTPRWFRLRFSCRDWVRRLNHASCRLFVLVAEYGATIRTISLSGKGSAKAAVTAPSGDLAVPPVSVDSPPARDKRRKLLGAGAVVLGCGPATSKAHPSRAVLHIKIGVLFSIILNYPAGETSNGCVGCALSLWDAHLPCGRWGGRRHLVGAGHKCAAYSTPHIGCGLQGGSDF